MFYELDNGKYDYWLEAQSIEEIFED